MSTLLRTEASPFGHSYVPQDNNSVSIREEDSRDRVTEETEEETDPSFPSDVLIFHGRAYHPLPFYSTPPTHQPTTTTTTTTSTPAISSRKPIATWVPPPEYCVLWDQVLKDLSETPLSETLQRIKDLWYDAKSGATPEEFAHLRESGRKYVAVLAGNRIHSKMLQEINAEIVSALTSHFAEKLHRFNAAYQEKTGASIYKCQEMHFEECQQIKETADARVNESSMPSIWAELLKARIDREMCEWAQDQLEGFSGSKVKVELFWQLLSSFTCATKEQWQRALELGPVVYVCASTTNRQLIERLWSSGLAVYFTTLEYLLFEKIRKECCDAFTRAEPDAELAELTQSVQNYLDVIMSQKGPTTQQDRTRAGCTLIGVLQVSMAQKLKDAEDLFFQKTKFAAARAALSQNFQKCDQTKTQALVEKNRGSISEIKYLLTCLRSDVTYYDSIQKSLQSFAGEK